MSSHRYVLALGSNVPHHRFGRPREVLRAAIASLEKNGLMVERVSPFMRSDPLGPSRRHYTNAAVLVSCGEEPRDLLTILKVIEHQFGRKRGGKRWGARVLDIDIILWDGGTWSCETLTVPHVSLRERDFVLRPAAAIAPDWRDPISGLKVKHLFSRLTRTRQMPSDPARGKGP